METETRLRSRPYVRAGVSLTVLLAFASCSTLKKNTSGSDTTRATVPTITSEVMGPPAPTDVNSKNENTNLSDPYGPAPMQLKPLVLVFGPGLARSFAYAGVLKALEEEKIPIGGIITTEMGTLIAALYASSATINSFEWNLMKLRDDSLYVKQSMFSGLMSSVSDNPALEKTLNQVFGSKTFKQLKFPIHVALQHEKTNDYFIISEGSVKKAVRASLGVPPLLSSVEWPDSKINNKVHSAGSARPFPVSEARLVASGPVVVIDVMHSGSDQRANEDSELKAYLRDARAAGQDALKDAELVIIPDLTGIGFQDFQKRNDIIFRGKKAALMQRSALRHLVGLPSKETNP